MSKDVDIGIRFDGVADQMRDAAECILEDLDMTLESAPAVYVDRGSDFGSDTFQRNVFAKKFVIAVFEEVHACIIERQDECGLRNVDCGLEKGGRPNPPSTIRNPQCLSTVAAVFSKTRGRVT